VASAIADYMSNYEHVEHQEISRDMLLSNYEHVNSPTHYNTYSIETIDMMVRVFGKEKVADFCEINAFKYRMRMGTKPFNSIEQDLKKEQWYLNKAKELRTDCVELMDKQRKLDLEYRRFNHECVE
jgi:hypothetical protein